MKKGRKETAKTTQRINMHVDKKIKNQPLINDDDNWIQREI